ncbi:MAG: 2Fe-2S iron-sulfur cluster-binding protein [Methylococcales bacterium]
MPTLSNSAERFCITIIDTNEKYMCSTNAHLLKGMKTIGKRGIPSGCHGGGCGVCKIQIVKGNVETISMSRAYISKKEEEEGIVLACRTFPKTDVSLKVIGKLSRNILKPNTIKKYGFV